MIYNGGEREWSTLMIERPDPAGQASERVDTDHYEALSVLDGESLDDLTGIRDGEVVEENLPCLFR